MFGKDPYHAVKSGSVGAMLQSGGLMPEVTVGEAVALVAGLHRGLLSVETNAAPGAGIADIAGQRVDRISGGQTQRVRFALAIAGECDLIVLDEPTTAMDVETRQRFWASMKEEVAEGKTLLFATHYLEEADQAADRILVINRGRLLADGSPEDIKKRAGAKRMSFRLPGADEAVLLGLPGVTSLETRHDLVHNHTTHSDATPGTPARAPTPGRPRSRSAASAPRAGVRHHRGRRQANGHEPDYTQLAHRSTLTGDEDANDVLACWPGRDRSAAAARPAVLRGPAGDPPDHRQADQATSKAYGVDFAAYYMVAMATFAFGAFAGGRSTATPSGSPGTQGRLDQAAAAHPCPPTPWSPDP